MSYLPSIPFPNGAAAANSPRPWADSACLFEPEQMERAELRAIVLRAQAGDLGAQSELVHRYTKRISGFVRPIISQPSAVEDVVQIVFIKMVRHIDLVRDPATFQSWLFTLARNTAFDFIRRARSRPLIVSDDGHFVHAVTSTNPRNLSEITEALEAALLRLSPKDRRIVRLFVDGIGYRSIAQRERLTIGAVKLRLFRVRPFLRASVGKAIGLSISASNVCPPPQSRVAA